MPERIPRKICLENGKVKSVQKHQHGSNNIRIDLNRSSGTCPSLNKFEKVEATVRFFAPFGEKTPTRTVTVKGTV